MAKRELVDYSLAHSICREGGHWWEYMGWDYEAHTAQRRCIRGCHTWRYDTYDANHRKQRSRYRYPAGYLAKGITKVDAAIECRKLVERLITSRGITFVQRMGKASHELLVKGRS